MQAKIFVEKQKVVGQTVFMTKQPKKGGEKLSETPVSVRMPTTLEKEISGIARETHRSRNNAILQLLRKGIDAYKSDGILVDTRSAQAEEYASPER